MRCSAGFNPSTSSGLGRALDHRESIVADPVGMRLNLASVSMSRSLADAVPRL